VAGGAGFIGSHLCERLLSDGWSVACLDSLVTGSAANVEHLIRNPLFSFRVCDIRHPANWDGDMIFNLASPASPPAYQRDRVLTLTTNAEGTRNLLELARRTGARFVQASTSEVYGDPEEHPQRETYPGRVNPIGPRSCYDEGKRYAEALVVAAVAEWGVDARIARIFNTYGPRMDPEDGRVVVTFIGRLIEGRPLPVFGDGSQTRSLCYVEDLVEGLLRLATAPDLAGEVFNLGSPDERTILELAEAVLRVAGRRAEIEFLALPQDDPTRRCPEISRARHLLGWSPQVALDEGLRRTWEWYRDRAEEP
jgi:nucleoside-diphosphate-sugar epimerase